MKMQRGMINRIAEQAMLSEINPFLPIVEIAGDHRVLVENHKGILQYSTDLIGIRVQFGTLCISGCGLLVTHMTNTKLIVTGQIQQLTINRRG